MEPHRWQCRKFLQASDLLKRACDNLETAKGTGSRQAVENVTEHLITAVCIWEARLMLLQNSRKPMVKCWEPPEPGLPELLITPRPAVRPSVQRPIQNPPPMDKGSHEHEVPGQQSQVSLTRFFEQVADKEPIPEPESLWDATHEEEEKFVGAVFSTTREFSQTEKSSKLGFKEKEIKMICDQYFHAQLEEMVYKVDIQTVTEEVAEKTTSSACTFHQGDQSKAETGSGWGTRLHQSWGTSSCAKEDAKDLAQTEGPRRQDQRRLHRRARCSLPGRRRRRTQ